MHPKHGPEFVETTFDCRSLKTDKVTINSNDKSKVIELWRVETMFSVMVDYCINETSQIQMCRSILKQPSKSKVLLLIMVQDISLLYWYSMLFHFTSEGESLPLVQVIWMIVTNEVSYVPLQHLWKNLGQAWSVELIEWQEVIQNVN